MVFPPFSREDYRQDIHDTLYQCLAENSVGAIISKETHIRGGKKVTSSFFKEVVDFKLILKNSCFLKFLHFFVLYKYLKEVNILYKWKQCDVNVTEHTVR